MIFGVKVKLFILLFVPPSFIGSGVEEEGGEGSVDGVCSLEDKLLSDLTD